MVGRLPGRGRLAGEAVVLGAHYDHLGIGAPVAGDSIYNGAFDNASGTAGMLAVAEAFVRSGARPSRSVKRAQVQIRVMLLPQDFDAGTEGVSENQNVPASATRNRSCLNRIAENSPEFRASSLPTPTVA